MPMLGRFLLRFVLVPLGMLAATLAGLAVAIAVAWSKVTATLAADPRTDETLLTNAVLYGPVLFASWSAATAAILTPAVLGVATSELLAIRSWLFHAAAGALSGYAGWISFARNRDAYDGVFDSPSTAVAMGLAGGLAYWLVAGWTAGFWKRAGRGRAAALSEGRSSNGEASTG